MKIWVDADACPKVIKEILYRTANRTKIQMTFVSNNPLYTPLSPFIKKIVVGKGFDEADQEIVRQMEAGDLVITADIPLADAVVHKNGVAIDPRGELYNESNIKERLSLRNFNADLRSAGMLTGGPATLGKKETQVFANSLDKYITLRLKQLKNE